MKVLYKMAKFAVITGLITVVLGITVTPFHMKVGAIDPENPIPIMAYYYIWFDESSWDRAKIDYPLLGRYSSDDPEIIEQHIQSAKSAGIDGFIVSWKSTFQLDSRLEMVMDIATANDFKLWIIYQGLDFDRNPLPIDRIENDLEHFLIEYATHPAFQMYDRPVVIWSGTWEFSREEIESITMNFRDAMYILATERNTEGYLRLADLVDGNAYYWASVNPTTFSSYQEKLDSMGKIVHDGGGLWIAPAAPGFDARLIGGTSIVDRNNGEILRIELNAALKSNADVIGLISWNEFSENTHIEPSEKYGNRALDILAGRELSPVPTVLDFDSNAPGTTRRESPYTLFVLAGLGVVTLVSIAVLIQRDLVSHRKT